MVGTIVLLVTLILVCAIGFIIIYQKLDSKSSIPNIKIPDVNVTVHMDKQSAGEFIPASHPLTEDKKPDWFVSPLDYINKTETKAHIKWQDSD